jgi:pyruvate/2-oxoacid:ferredoxin oxidoreductase beta subunit
MTTGRAVLIMTSLLVTALGVWFAVARWDSANRLATIVSALGAAAAVGVAVWAALRAPQPRRSVVVSDTGPAVADSGGAAITGMSRKTDSDDAAVRVERTGRADASDGGDAVTGIQID